MHSIYNFFTDKYGNAWIAWIALYLLIVGTVLLRINIEATGYVTPDSFYYLEVAQNILNGLGPYGPKVFEVANGKLIALFDPAVFGHPEKYELHFMSVWPLGYPICIAGVAYVTGLTIFWASKLLNLLFLGLSFFLLYKNFKNTGLLAAFYFCSYPILEIVSYSWSELGFLTFLLLLVISLDKILKRELKLSKKYYGFVFIALSGMFLLRYAGFIFYIFSCTIILFLIFRKETTKAIFLALVLFLATLIALFYLYNNYIQSGYITGMPRAETQELSKEFLLYRLSLGIFNQMHLIKQFRFNYGADTYLYIILSGFQLSLLLFWKDLKGLPFWKSTFTKICLVCGTLYLLFLIYLTFSSTIDPFDYRTLSPFSHLIYIALFISIGSHFIEKSSRSAYLYFAGFFFISLIMNLPKQFLIEWVTDKW